MTQRAVRNGILNFALALLTCVIAKPTHAVELAHLGVGDVLMFPYFTVQSERAALPSADAWPYATLLTITNHSARIKAARVRFHEGRLGRQVYETVVYLSPRDTWVAAVVRTGDGAGLVTPDLSCSDPAVSKDENNPTLFGLDPTSGLVLIPGDQTREGHIEVFQMGDYGSGIDAPVGSVTAAVMPVGPGRVPRDCGRVHGDTGSESVVMPGSLSGSAVQINVATGVEFGQGATALTNFNSERTLWFNPSNDRPTLADAAPATSVIHDPLLGTVRTQWEKPIDAVSAVLMRSTIAGEFILDRGTASQSSWVVSMPTRRHHVMAGQEPRSPFTSGGNNALAGEFVAHEHWGAMVFDRNGVPWTINWGFIPPGPSVRSFAWIDTVIAFNAGGLLGSATGLGSISSSGTGPQAFLPILPPFENGWMRLPLHLPEPLPPYYGAKVLPHFMVGGATAIFRPDGVLETRPTITLYGLPVIGFVAHTYSNGAIGFVPGEAPVLSNYGSAVPLNGEIRIQ